LSTSCLVKNIWLLLQDRLWTAARLQLRGRKNNYFCALCERNLETAQHLFFECPYSRLVWQLVASWSSCNSLNPASWRDERDLEDWYSQAFRTRGKRGKSLVILTLWIIWNWRNAVIFRGCWKTAQATVTEIKDTAQQWSLAGCKAFRPATVVQVVSE
jgi:hypothetical protein